MINDNPAARLKAILDAGLKENKDQSCITVWRKLLEANPNDAGDLFHRLGKTMELPQKIIFLLQTHSPHHIETSSHWRNQIDSAFMNQQLSGKWESFINQINVHCINYLSFIADILHNKLNAKTVQLEKINDLISKITTLIAEIENSDLESDLKLYLLRDLSILLQTLREYKITGGEAILKQVESIVGHSCRDKKFLDFLKDHKLGQRVLDDLNAVAATLTIYLSIPQLSQTVPMILPLLSN